jgi:hypothetical protein
VSRIEIGTVLPCIRDRHAGRRRDAAAHRSSHRSPTTPPVSTGWPHTTTHAIDVVIGLLDEAHLHLQGQNSRPFDVIKPPAGLWTYPLVFDNVDIRRGGSL